MSAMVARPARPRVPRAALLLVVTLALAGPVRAEPVDASDETGAIKQHRVSWNRLRDSNPMKLLSILSWSEFAKGESAPAEAPARPAPLHRLGAGARQLLLSGEADARDVPVFLTAGEARSHAHLHLTSTNAVSVMAEASRMRVLVNDVPVSDTPIASPTAADPGVLDIDLPPSLLEPGYNAVRIEVQERHRVDCSTAATYELWTQIDPATAGFTFDGLAASSLSDVADLPALPPSEDGTVPLRLVVPKNTDAAALDRLIRSAEAVALRGRFAHPDVEVLSAPADRPGLDIVAGTADELKRADLADLLPDDDSPVVLRPGTTPGHSTLVVSGQAAAEVDAAVASLAPDGGAEVSGTPAGQRAVALAGGRPVEGGSALTLRDLGVPSQEFSGRLFRTGFDLALPPDFYPADYGVMTMRLDAAYAPGLDRGSQILVRVNGRDAASLPLGDRAGDAFRQRPITVPLGSLRPGLNHVAVEAELGTAADKICDAAAAAAGGTGGGKRFALLDSTTVELPAIARIARMPSLSATAAAGFPYAGRKAPGLLYLPHPDADAVSAAATLLSRAAVAAGGPLDARLALGRNVDLKGPALVVAAFADLPPPVIEAAGLDAVAMRDAWSHLDARSAAGAKLREARALAGRTPSLPDMAAGNERDGATLFRRWSDDVSAGQWRFDPGKLLAGALRKAAGLSADNLPRWGRVEERVAVTSDMRLAIAQHEAPGGRGDTWTLVLAPTGEALRSSVLALTAPDLWDQLDGRVATLDTRSAKLATVQPQVDYFIPTAALSPGNVRLIAAGWLSTEIEVYVLCFALIAIALGAATAATVKRYGVQP